MYDACVLYPAPLRDLLVLLGLCGLYRARWSTDVQEEWKRNLLKNRPDLRPELLTRTCELMDLAIPDAAVTGYDELVPSLDLPDCDDRHVLAAAIRGNAQVIVTFNLKDFPDSVLGGFDIEALHPDDFICDLWDLDRAAVLSCVQKQRRRLKKPPMEAMQYLDMMSRQGLPQIVKALRPYISII